MIKYHCKNIRELFGHKYDLDMSKNSALPRFYACLLKSVVELEGRFLAKGVVGWERMRRESEWIAACEGERMDCSV